MEIEDARARKLSKLSFNTNGPGNVGEEHVNSHKNATAQEASVAWARLVAHEAAVVTMERPLMVLEDELSASVRRQCKESEARECDARDLLTAAYSQWEPLFCDSIGDRKGNNNMLFLLS